MLCFDKSCVFHHSTEKQKCLIPEDSNLFVTDGKDVVRSCINRIYSEKESSVEGKQRLKNLRRIYNGRICIKI